MGVIADSIDQLADCLVYGVVLASLSRPALFKRRAARLGGVVQVVLASLAFIEVARRAAMDARPPSFAGMMLMSGIAVIGNAVSHMLLKRARGGGIGVRASMVFSYIDVWANCLMMAAAVLVHVLESTVPDLVAASLVLAMVLFGAAEIFKMSG